MGHMLVLNMAACHLVRVRTPGQVGLPTGARTCTGLVRLEDMFSRTDMPDQQRSQESVMLLAPKSGCNRWKGSPTNTLATLKQPFVPLLLVPIWGGGAC